MASEETSLPRIVQLANTISRSVSNIQQVLSARGIPSPSFDQDASFHLPLDITEDHDAVLDAAAELSDLLLEPLNLIHRHGGHNNSLCMQAIAEFGIADMVPPHGTVTFAEIAEQTPMSASLTARLLRHAMTMRIFHEPEPGRVAHTAASKVLHRSAANEWLRAGTVEMWPAATKMVDAIRKWPGSQEPNETGYSLANNTSETIYEIFGKDADRAGRWAKGMAVFLQRPQFSHAYVTDHYDWASLGPIQLVDFGGSQGHVSVALASKFDSITAVVQDMDKVIEGAPPVPERLAGRLSYMAHDLFAPQPVRGADVYFLRWVLHNWSDKYCLKILQGLLPALKDGARVIVQESLMPEPGDIALWREKNLRATDLNMAAAFNAQERTVEEYKSLFGKVDAGFTLQSITEPPGSALAMLEFVWTGSQ